MPDREKVIRGLEYCVLSDDCRPCEYWMEFDDTGCQIMKDALALLKEQEAVEPYSMNAERTYGICPKCGKIVFRYGNVEENHYCGVCGQAVKWDEETEVP